MAMPIVSPMILVMLRPHTLTNAGSRHDLIAACKPHARSDDPPSHTYQKRFRSVSDKPTTKCAAQSCATREDCYRW